MRCSLGYDLMNIMKSNKPFIGVLLIQIMYAGRSLFAKAVISKGMNPYVFVAYRQAFATLSLAPFAYFFESNKSASLSLNLLCKIFFVSLCGITLSLNLDSLSMNYTSATFAVAITNIVPAFTFIMAVFLRMESISIKKRHGLAKIVGTVISLLGALAFVFLKGPPIYSVSHKENSVPSSTECYSKGDWLKGSLAAISSNIAWSLWIIMQSVEQKMAVQSDVEANQYTLKACVESMTAVTNLSNRLQSRANEVQQLNSQLALLQRMYKDARAEISVLRAENKELKRKATVMFRFGGPPYAAVEEYGGVNVLSGQGNTETGLARDTQDKMLLGAGIGEPRCCEVGLETGIVGEFRKWRTRGPIVKEYPALLRLTTLQTFFSSIQSAIWAVAAERNLSSWKLGWDVNLLSIIYCGLVSTGITYWLRIWIIEKKGPVFLAVFTPLALVITAISSAILWKETLHWGSACGAVLLICGLYGFLWAKHEEGTAEKNDEGKAEKVEQKSDTIVENA
ncbi:hypothetical protein HYC85_008065 [Camellia sinensis]|uniref:EamA domain-containing protein n=1 Tax=Camellia sinensis TaxID=4442 RepID=A0A7J7HRF5_CAMSI|nr:hypothetical protein HYC85_008065 [Camellia sinensis]